MFSKCKLLLRATPSDPLCPGSAADVSLPPVNRNQSSDVKVELKRSLSNFTAEVMRQAELELGVEESEKPPDEFDVDVEPSTSTLHGTYGDIDDIEDLRLLFDQDGIDAPEPEVFAEKWIGCKGGKVTLSHHEITFPPMTFDKLTKTRFCLSTDPPVDLPDWLIPISLVLHCSPGSVLFRNPVIVKAPTWCSKQRFVPPSISKPVLVYIYTRHRNDEWFYSEAVELGDSNFITYSCPHFCSKVAAIRRESLASVEFDLKYFLCKNNLGRFVSCHFFDNSVVAAELKKEWIDLGFTLVHAPTTKHIVRIGDVSRVALHSREPGVYTFDEAGDSVLIIDDAFYRRNKSEAFSFLLNPFELSAKILEFVYQVGNKSYLMRVRRLEKEENQESTGAAQERPNQTVHVNFGDQFQDVVTNKLIQGNARAVISETGTTSLAVGGSNEMESTGESPKTTIKSYFRSFRKNFQSTSSPGSHRG